MLIKAAINGGRRKADHAAAPVSPDEQAAAVVECLKAGAGAVHLHVRSVAGSKFQPSLQPGDESLYAEDVARTLLAVRAVAPNAQVGVSTGEWILPDPSARLQAVAGWKVLPEFASVNFNEDGSVELAKLLLSRGVEVEAGLYDAQAAVVFLESGVAGRCIRALLEPQEQEIERALETVDAIEKVLASGMIELPILLHGTEATVWPMMDEALARGYDVRIGLEDTLVLPDGNLARDNAELLGETLRRVKVMSK